MNVDTLVAPVVMAGVMMVVLTTLTNLMLKMRSQRLTEQKHQVELEIMRRSLESRVYRETDALSSTPERWKDINHLVLEALRKYEQMTDAPVRSSPLFDGLGLNLTDVQIERGKVFFLTPFHDRFDATFELVLGVCSRVGLKCTRGDEEFISGGVLAHIVKELASAQLIIANLDGRNPNVFYELGIAHALGKRAILITSNLDEVPFDIKSQRLVVWRTPSELKEHLSLAITRGLADR